MHLVTWARVGQTGFWIKYLSSYFVGFQFDGHPTLAESSNREAKSIRNGSFFVQFQACTVGILALIIQKLMKCKNTQSIFHFVIFCRSARTF